MLKADPIVSAQLLHQLFYNIWDAVTLPANWMQGVLVKVPKKGDLTVCDDWRGIMLLSIVRQSSLQSDLEPEKIDANLRRQQAGFRTGRSCADHIVTLRIILKQVNELQHPLYLVFIDYEKAFDRLKSRKYVGSPDLIEAQYEAFSCRILHDGVLSDPIRVVAGVRQGCILSQLLFLAVIDEVLIGAIDREPNRGLLWQPITMDHLNDFELADGVALLAQRRSEMQSKLDDRANPSSAAGLKINVNKTKSLDINTANASSFTVAGQAVENVESFQYLGSQMCTKIDIGARIKKARAAFCEFKKYVEKTIRLIDAPKPEYSTQT
ncbi:uncharacterized protein LOC131676147 [Topomyia yanbarensis]|uniref:uncharacterized protein LOC131676147 n=1 Tax=Topomyia yanbarensis TaxID=2498891 RepID=UPI00273CC265|nr:uncharacterized protein LOC131676147 [Topomyia yanbarensis]